MTWDAHLTMCISPRFFSGGGRGKKQRMPANPGELSGANKV